MSRLNFKIEALAAHSGARAASFTTAHGEVNTPIFMPVGTQATVKTQTIKSLKTSGSRVLLANTYHLLLRPGAEVFKKLGGIHRFMNWDGPVLTDSGGFQIFSLPNARQMNEAGASFQSYVDGRTHLLSPESSIEMQKAIGSDIMMVLDQCIPSIAEHAQALNSMELTHRWAARSLEARGDSNQALFGIVQGACFEDLRRRSAEFLTLLPFDGFAIGGLAVGETKSQREDFTELTTASLPRDLPRYLMGVGTPIDLLEAVHRGVDMFDCILPSQLAQRGTAFTSEGRLQLRRIHHKFSEDSLDPKCGCETCTSHSRAYLHHLYKTGETLGWKLLTSHNLTFYHRMMAEIRRNILQGTFRQYYDEQRVILAASDNTQPSGPPKPRIRKKKINHLGDYELSSRSLGGPLGTEGQFSIRQTSSGEVMHPGAAPLEEAHRLYVEQSKLASRILGDGESERSVLTIWDVGLGAATNAMAAIRCVESIFGINADQKLKEIQLVSFERDLDSLRLALINHEKFPHLHHPAPHQISKFGIWEKMNPKITWRLIEDDFLAQIESAPTPDLIFYDPFSTKKDIELWSVETFNRLFNRCIDHRVELYTYTCATAVRTAMLKAGFYVARGFSSGRQAETTVAFNSMDSCAEANLSLLDFDWLQRWNRSQAKIPPGVYGGNAVEFETSILNHSQFKMLSNPISQL